MKAIDVLTALSVVATLSAMGPAPPAVSHSGTGPRTALGSLTAAEPLHAPSEQTASVAGIVRVEGEPTADVVVYLEAEGAVDDLPDPVATPPVIDQSHLEFIPGVVAVRLGMTVDFLNSDGILHNVFSPGWSGEAFDLGTYPSGATRGHTFTRTGPHVILCKVHPEMVAYVVVVETPWFAVSDSVGRFVIPAVPAGRYRLTAWQRGAEERHAEVLVPRVGMDALTVDLPHPGGFASHDAS